MKIICKPGQNFSIKVLNLSKRVKLVLDSLPRSNFHAVDDDTSIFFHFRRENDDDDNKSDDNDDDAEVFWELAQTWRELELESTTVFKNFAWNAEPA